MAFKQSDKNDNSTPRQSRRLFVFFAVVLACLAYSWPRRNTLFQINSTISRPLVEIQPGTVVGTLIQDNDHPIPVEAFFGIPYALPPVGKLRFARPVPLEQFDGVVDCSTYGPRCPGRQLVSLGKGPDNHSEDCLTLNVFRHVGTGKKGAKVPVAVYIHGGAFNRGTARMHDTASMLAWSSEPFIAVSFNYRIGALGFLNSAVTARANILNVGLHDQIEVLKWVRKNVAEFGGDPDNVTIIGLSAGAHSIGHHIMNTNTDEQLFHKAIMESGGSTSRALHPYDSKLHEKQFRELLSATGCDGVPDEKAVDCLRDTSYEDIIAASGEVFAKWNLSVKWAWQPVIDDEVIYRRPLEAWRSGDWNHVPILTGFNHNEGTMYVPKNLSRPAEFEQFFSTLLPQLSPSTIQEMADLYPDPVTRAGSPYHDTRGLQIGPQFKRVEAAYGQYAYACPVRQTAQLAVTTSPTRGDPPVYLYHWAVNATVLGGANHADQMPYETMASSIRKFSSTQHQIAGHFHAYMTSFVLTGNPNTVRGRFPDRPDWQTYKDINHSDGYGTMVFGHGNDERAGGTEKGVVANFAMDTWARNECDFWWSHSDNYED